MITESFIIKLTLRILWLFSKNPRVKCLTKIAFSRAFAETNLL